ncbi:MAG: RHS repeat-associated core domain-containing protein, partial [Flavobacteriales bacterium]|nr:RHS repeat-associated core domain-containing protein [Flavobacteriales bacterium]
LSAKGEIISYEEYMPYGGTAFSAGKNQKEVALKDYRYSGKERDDSTGLYYYGQRYYVPWMCRWLNPDPIGQKGGLNLYEFVQSNPINLIDPNGESSKNYKVIKQVGSFQEAFTWLNKKATSRLSRHREWAIGIQNNRYHLIRGGKNKVVLPKGMTLVAHSHPYFRHRTLYGIAGRNPSIQDLTEFRDKGLKRQIIAFGKNNWTLVTNYNGQGIITHVSNGRVTNVSYYSLSGSGNNTSVTYHSSPNGVPAIKQGQKIGLPYLARFISQDPKLRISFPRIVIRPVNPSRPVRAHIRPKLSIAPIAPSRPTLGHVRAPVKTSKTPISQTGAAQVVIFTVGTHYVKFLASSGNKTAKKIEPYVNAANKAADAVNPLSWYTKLIYFALGWSYKEAKKNSGHRSLNNYDYLRRGFGGY